MPELAFLTTEEVAERFRTTASTVRYWRHLGDYGPKGVKIGRRVLYATAEIERWEAQKLAEAGA